MASYEKQMGLAKVKILKFRNSFTDFTKRALFEVEMSK